MVTARPLASQSVCRLPPCFTSNLRLCTPHPSFVLPSKGQGVSEIQIHGRGWESGESRAPMKCYN